MTTKQTLPQWILIIVSVFNFFMHYFVDASMNFGVCGTVCFAAYCVTYHISKYFEGGKHKSNPENINISSGSARLMADGTWKTDNGDSITIV